MPGKIQHGDHAPDFTAEDHDGQTHRLRDLRGRNVVLYFYPKDDTPGCTKEACSFRDALGSLQDHNTVVFGVSTDDAESHRRFAEKYDLTFPLLVDPDRHILDSYGVPLKNGSAARMTFLIDDKGVVQRVWEHVDPAVHVGEIERELQSATTAA